MSRSSKTPRKLISKRLGILFAISLAATALILALGFWLYRRIPDPVFWQAGVVCLTAAEIVYCVTAVLTAILLPLLIVLLLKRRRTHTAGRKLARGLLLCGSLAIALLLAEAASAIRLRIVQKGSAVPAGGLAILPASSRKT